LPASERQPRRSTTHGSRRSRAIAGSWRPKRAGAADAALAAARAGHYPSVSVSTAASRWRDTPAFDFSAAGVPAALPLFGGSTLTTANAQVSVPLYTGGAIGANVDAATAALDSQGRTAETLRQDTKLAVAEAYVGVLSAQSALEVARSTKAGLAAHAREVEDMRRVGQVPNNDYLAAAVRSPTLRNAAGRERLSSRTRCTIAASVGRSTRPSRSNRSMSRSARARALHRSPSSSARRRPRAQSSPSSRPPPKHSTHAPQPRAPRAGRSSP
jgi:outer membrane protein TolC